MRTADHLKAIDDRLDRLDGRVARLDDRVARLDDRVARLDDRVDRLDAKVDERFAAVDRRFDEQRAHTSAMFESSRADFNNLYDFVKAQAERTDERFEQVESENRVRFADLQTAIAALAPRVRGARRRG